MNNECSGCGHSMCHNTFDALRLEVLVVFEDGVRAKTDLSPQSTATIQSILQEDLGLGTSAIIVATRIDTGPHGEIKKLIAAAKTQA